MKLLFVIPHFFRHRQSDDGAPTLRGKHASIHSHAETRVKAVERCLLSLHQTFGPSQAIIQHSTRRTTPANQSLRHQIHIVVVTTTEHLVNQLSLPDSAYEHVTVDADPTHLGFCCQQLLLDRRNDYDFFAFLEDDLTIDDPLFIQKLVWFNSHLGDGKVLLPNRFERSPDAVYPKCYVDGDLKPHVTQRFQQIQVEPELKSMIMGHSVRFVRPLNPHSGCYFLNANQLGHWGEQRGFAIPTADFIGPLESAATLGIMTTFQVYKPAAENAGFLEIEHNDDRFTRLVRLTKNESDP